MVLAVLPAIRNFRQEAVKPNKQVVSRDLMLQYLKQVFTKINREEWEGTRTIRLREDGQVQEVQWVAWETGERIGDHTLVNGDLQDHSVNAAE